MLCCSLTGIGPLLYALEIYNVCFRTFCMFVDILFHLTNALLVNTFKNRNALIAQPWVRYIFPMRETFIEQNTTFSFQCILYTLFCIHARRFLRDYWTLSHSPHSNAPFFLIRRETMSTTLMLLNWPAPITPFQYFHSLYSQEGNFNKIF